MATLALAALGAAAGGALLPAGLSVLGTTLTGAAIGSQIGAMAGSMIDNALLAGSGKSRAVEGPRLQELQVTTSAEGNAIPRLYGSARLGGQIIWATNLEEEIVTTDLGGSGKGAPKIRATQTEYRYYANIAVALTEGPISGIGRVWADGREIDLSDFTTRLYRGTEDQLPDALVEAKEGAGLAPAYRGLAYLVFERLPLADFGNRIPQFSFEVSRPVDDVTSRIRGVVMIPGSGEFVYAPERVVRNVGRIGRQAENVHTLQGGTDWQVSVDQLQSQLPQVSSVSLVVSWFGTSLDAASCELRPAVDRRDKTTTPETWSVAGETRATAHLVSEDDGNPAYGGTPSDASVVAAITDLKARGISVVLSPFILMDVPAANTLPDPYSSSPTQPAYPWRGRITVSPAPGRAGTPDKTPAAAASLAAFIGTASPSHFTVADGIVTYSGPAEWSFRRFILHHAALAKAAGGVDAFVLCSELRGLTQIRSTAWHYPFVAALTSLAADVRAMLGPATKILYAADWSEYFGHQPADGTGDVHFHLDPLWSSPDIDAIGIDCYWPLSDWRDGNDHLDAVAGTPSIYDLAYLTGNIAGGEGYDWYYASPADRDAQIRTPITDGAGKPWVFRYKDLRSWWSNPHHDRPGGIEIATPTAWVPQSKPVWLMEVGCPAVDKGSNEPNVFIDPKSVESRIPHYSSGVRDDTIQRRYIEAFLEAFDPSRPGALPDQNPVSAVYGGPMLDLTRLHVYCWDARPYPAFPDAADIWSDATNWQRGHWLNGRVAGVGLAELVRRLLADYGITDTDTSKLSGLVPGYVLDRLLSARQCLEPLELAGFFDSLESGGRLVFRHRAAAPPVLTLTADDLVEIRPNAPLETRIRAQETELPDRARVTYIAATGDYLPAVAESRRSAGASERISSATLPMVLDHVRAAAIADTMLHEAWATRERMSFTLPPSRLALEPGDVIALPRAGLPDTLLRILSIADSGARTIDARVVAPSVYRPGAATGRPSRPSRATPAGAPDAVLLDLPRLDDADPEAGLYAAAAQTPWPGSIAIWRSPEDSGFQLKGLLPVPAIMGATTSALPATVRPWRIDYATTVDVVLDRGELASVTDTAFLSGANLAAIETSPGRWELIQFRDVELIGPSIYRLSHLLRAQRGTEPEATAAAPGARFVLLDGAVRSVATSNDDIGKLFQWRIGPARRDIGDPDYLAVTHAIAGIGLRPLHTVHVRASRDSAGNLELTWARRTRTSGDTWDGLDVPLGEETEHYAIDILDGAAVVRSHTATTPQALYTAADQIADFGAVQSAVTLSIAQVSLRFGPGAPLTVTV